MIDPGANYSSRFKLFHEHHTRETIFRRLASQFEQAGLCQSQPRITLCLAAGNIRNQADCEMLKQHLEANRWLLFDPEMIRNELRFLVESGYDNSVAAITAKVLLRERK